MSDNPEALRNELADLLNNLNGRSDGAWLCPGYDVHSVKRILRAALAQQATPPAEPVELSDERIDYIADLVVKGMPDGIRGFCKEWGWRQFARAILADCAGHVATPQGEQA